MADVTEYTDWFQDRWGNALYGATVRPVPRGTGAVYSDEAGTTPITSVSTDLEGKASWWWTADEWDVKVTHPKLNGGVETTIQTVTSHPSSVVSTGVVDSASASDNQVPRWESSSGKFIWRDPAFLDSVDTGADRTGVADATSALNTMLAAAAGKRTVIRSGTYKLTATLELPSNTDLAIEPNTTFNLTADASSLMENADTAGGNTNITVRGGIGVTFQGNKASRTAGARNRGVYFANVTGLLVEGLTVDGAEDHGFQLTGCNKYTVRACIAQNCGKDSATSVGGSGFAVSTTVDLYGGNITDCWGTGNLRCGVKIGHGFGASFLFPVYAPITLSGFKAYDNGHDGSSPGIAFVGNGSGNDLRGWTCQGCQSWNNVMAGYEFETGASGGKITGCDATGNGTHGFYFFQATHFNTMTACTARNNSQTTANTYDGVHFADSGGGCLNNTVIGCVMKDDQVSPTQAYGLREAAGSGTNFTRVSDCQFSGNATGDQSLVGTGSGGTTFNNGALFTQPTVSTAAALNVRAAGDSADRIRLSTDGQMRFGTGGSAVDTTFGRIAAGIVGSGTGHKLVGRGGLGAGNSVAKTTLASPGTVTKMLEVFDAAGASLGGVPVYALGSFS